MIDIQSGVTIWFYQKDGRPHIEVRCPDCGSKPETAKGAANTPQLVYLLQCPKCVKTLIEYNTPEELSTDLAKIIEKWRV